MTFYCIGDADTVKGFRLAGIDGYVPVSDEDASAALERACEQPGLGILLLTQTVAAQIRGKVDEIRLERDHPLIVEIPGPEGPLKGRKSLRELAQRAVGVSFEREDL